MAHLKINNKIFPNAIYVKQVSVFVHLVLDSAKVIKLFLLSESGSQMFKDLISILKMFIILKKFQKPLKIAK